MNIVRGVVSLPKVIFAIGLIDKAESASVKNMLPTLDLLLVLSLGWLPGNSKDGSFFYKLRHLPSVLILSYTNIYRQ